MQNNQNYKVQYQPVQQSYSDSDLLDSQVCDPLQVNYQRAKHVLGFFSQQPDLTHKNIKSWHENIIEFDSKISSLVSKYQNEQNMPNMLKELCQMYEEIRIKFDIYMKKIPLELYQQLQQQFIDNLKVMPNDLSQKNPCMCQSFNYSSQIYQKEDRQTEYKNYQLNSLQKEQYREIIKKTITSFLNCQGGTIFLGIRDFDLTVQGVDLSRKNTDELKNIVSEIKRQIEPDCSQLVNVDFIPVKKWGTFYQGKWVVRIKVAQGDLNTLYAYTKPNDKYSFESAFRDDGSCQRYELQKFINEIRNIHYKGRPKSEPIQYVEPDPQYYLCEANEVQNIYQKYKQEINPLFQNNNKNQNSSKKQNQNQDKQQNNKQNQQIISNNNQKQNQNQINNYSNSMEHKLELQEKLQKIEQLQQQIKNENLKTQKLQNEFNNAQKTIKSLEEQNKNIQVTQQRIEILKQELQSKNNELQIKNNELQSKNNEVLLLKMQIDQNKSSYDSEKLIFQQRCQSLQENIEQQKQLIEQSKHLNQQYSDQIKMLRETIQIQNQQQNSNASFQNQNIQNDNFQRQNNQSNYNKNQYQNNKFNNNSNKNYDDQNQNQEHDNNNQNREQNNFNQNRDQNNYNNKNNYNFNKNKNNYNRDYNNQNYNRDNNSQTYSSRDQNNQDYNRDQNNQSFHKDQNNQNYNKDQNNQNQNRDNQKQNNDKFQNEQQKKDQIDQNKIEVKELNNFIKQVESQNNSSSKQNQNPNLEKQQQQQQRNNRARKQKDDDDKEYKYERNDSFEKKDDYDQKDEINPNQKSSKQQKQKDFKHPTNEDNSQNDDFHLVQKTKGKKKKVVYEQVYQGIEQVIAESQKDIINQQNNQKLNYSQNKFDELSQIYDNDNPIMPKQNQEELKEIEEDDNDEELNEEEDKINKTKIEFPKDIDSISQKDLEQYKFYISIVFGFEHRLAQALKIINSTLSEEKPYILVSKKNIIFLFFSNSLLAKKAWNIIHKQDGPFMSDKQQFQFMKMNFKYQKKNTQIDYNTKEKQQIALIYINNISKENQNELKQIFSCDSVIQAYNGWLLATEQHKLFDLNIKKTKKLLKSKEKSLGIVIGTTVTLKQIEKNQEMDKLILEKIVQSFLFKNVKINKSNDKKEITLSFECQIDAYIAYQILYEQKDISQLFQNNNKLIEIESLLAVPFNFDEQQ
ncbi:divergent AAA domain protein (macronuclear) [Tetrahymena thermophila SB210]|uniref:Divergent AAA domain protein n=1 Tax=Tetrahymena thermophila (strain SB210) TaxID=312017 RepID=Q22KP9_TETTS|nr:divergent AAA domain protein [Tetrahymena thermophila SB210]EAR85750.1 divergent AAA domain protein [Tetrahymena thermophila SB210]|eukprot:XP_001033413.1 divergent AAA domain protein [Tetrahymena thermophila SB210]